MTSQTDTLEELARVVLILGCGATLMAMGILAIQNPDTMYPLRAGVLLLLVLVILLNKEQALAKIIQAWRGGDGGD